MIKIKIESNEGLIIIYLFGELISANFHDIESDIKMEIEKKPAIIAFNFEDMNEIDSTGIGYLVKVRTLAIDNDVSLILYGMLVRVFELLSIAGMDHLFTIMSKNDFEDEYINEEGVQS